MPAGFVPMPSEYGAMKDLRTFAASVRLYRDKMVNSPVPDALGPAGKLTEKRQLLPVLTACTYGQMDEVDVFAGTLHAFAGGASGFSFFAGNCFDNPGKILALSTAAGLAAPFAEHFLSGETVSAPSDPGDGLQRAGRCGYAQGFRHLARCHAPASHCRDRHGRGSQQQHSQCCWYEEDGIFTEAAVRQGRHHAEWL